MGKKNEIEIRQDLVEMPLKSIPFINDDNLKYLQPVKAYCLNEDGELYHRYKVEVLTPMLAEHIKNTLYFKFVKDGNSGSPLIYVYANGYYKWFSDNEFKGMIAECIPKEIRRSKDIDEVFKLLLTEKSYYIKNEELYSNYDFINFKNGILNLNTHEWLKHTPDMIFTIQIPVDYHELDDCERGVVFEKYLDYLVDKDFDMRRCILESMGLAISNIPGYRTKKCILMVGEKDTGKTQIKKLLSELIGLDYCSSMELAKMSDSRFGTSELYNKRLVGSNDMQYTTVADMGVFKQLVGGDPVSVEFKNKGAFSYVYNGILWFLANDYPKFSGKKEQAIYQRFMIMPCNHVVPLDAQDPELLDKMLKEKEYIVSLCIQNLYNLRNRKYKFIESEKMKDSLKQYEVMNNTLLQFVDECCKIDNNIDVSKRLKFTQFKKYYQIWCRESGFKAIALKQKDIDDYLFPKYGTQIKNNHGYYKISNIKILPDFETDFLGFGIKKEED